MQRLYCYPPSGNSYKTLLALTMARPGADVDISYVDILKGESRTPEFLKKNPAGQVPVLRLENGGHLTESHAIVWLICAGTPFLPDEADAQAQVVKWMSFEQYLLEPKLGVARYWLCSRGLPPAECPVDIPALLDASVKALTIINGHLKTRSFFVGEKPTAADVAMFGYTPVAVDVDIDLDRFPGIQAWIKRVQALPKFTSIADEISRFEHSRRN